MADRAINQFEGIGGVVYDRYIQSPRVSGWLGRLQWGSDALPMREHMRRSVRDVPDGATVIDVPCGGGILLRYLDRGSAVRWLAVDASRTMLRRTERLAGELGIEGVEAILADAARMPFEDATADVLMHYNGLHHFPDAPAAVREAVRCMKPGAPIHGCMLLEGEYSRSDGLIRRYRKVGAFGPGGTRDDLERWLREAGLTDRVIACDGAIAVFDARRPA
jgi:SAM-dependent methyltransferase